MVDQILIWISAAIIVDAAALAGAELALCIQYYNPKRFSLPERTGFERGALAAAFTLMLLLVTCSLLWDLWHDNSLPHAQFPLVLRLTFTTPALLFANLSLYSILTKFSWNAKSDAKSDN